MVVCVLNVLGDISSGFSKIELVSRLNFQTYNAITANSNKEEPGSWIFINVLPSIIVKM